MTFIKRPIHSKKGNTAFIRIPMEAVNHLVVKIVFGSFLTQQLKSQSQSQLQRYTHCWLILDRTKAHSGAPWPFPNPIHNFKHTRSKCKWFHTQPTFRVSMCAADDSTINSLCWSHECTFRCWTGSRADLFHLSSKAHLVWKMRRPLIKFCLHPTTTLVSYIPKNVVLLSTLHTAADISDRGNRKPVIILDYNHNKGGVGNLDKVIGTYSCRRLTARWPLVILHDIINLSSMAWCYALRSTLPDVW